MTIRKEVERLIRVYELQKEMYQREIEKLKDKDDNYYLSNDITEIYSIGFDQGVLTKLEDAIVSLKEILKEND